MSDFAWGLIGLALAIGYIVLMIWLVTIVGGALVGTFGPILGIFLLIVFFSGK